MAVASVALRGDLPCRRPTESLTAPSAVPSTRSGARGPEWLFGLAHTGFPTPVFDVLGNPVGF